MITNLLSYAKTNDTKKKEEKMKNEEIMPMMNKQIETFFSFILWLGACRKKAKMIQTGVSQQTNKQTNNTQLSSAYIGRSSSSSSSLSSTK